MLPIWAIQPSFLLGHRLSEEGVDHDFPLLLGHRFSLLLLPEQFEWRFRIVFPAGLGEHSSQPRSGCDVLRMGFINLLCIAEDDMRRQAANLFRLQSCTISVPARDSRDRTWLICGFSAIILAVSSISFFFASSSSACFSSNVLPNSETYMESRTLC